MKNEKKIMREVKKDVYSSPEVEIMETKVQSVICTSGYTNPSESNPENINW